MPSVLITGANRGLGLEFARQYAVAGWQVVTTCRSPEGAVDLNNLDVEVHALDVTDFAQMATLAEATLRGRVFDVLINNAGIYGDHQTLGDLAAGVWEQVLLTNTIAPIKMAECFLPHILGSQRKTMAFLSSRMGSIADNSGGNSYMYRSAKAGLNAAVRSLTIDTRARGLRTVLLHPGWVQTDMGGANATVTPHDSVAGLRRVIEGLTAEQSGAFLDYMGQAIPW